ncbi:MAG: hypothetical protein V3T72_02595 [Thermoanaerobaculia bacterium]
MNNPYVVRRTVENTYLVRQRDRRRRRELLGVVVAVVLVGGGLLAYTSIHIEILRSGYRVDVLERQLRGLEQTERERQLAIAQSTSPERIEARAIEAGMRPPVLDQMVFYGELLAARGER